MYVCVRVYHTWKKFKDASNQTIMPFRRNLPFIGWFSKFYQLISMPTFFPGMVCMYVMNLCIDVCPSFDFMYVRTL